MTIVESTQPAQAAPTASRPPAPAVLPASMPEAQGAPRAASPGLELHARAQYVHVLPGRLRVRVAEVRGCAHTALRVQSHLAQLRGVHSARASHRTGSVLVHFDASKVEAHDVLWELVGLGVLAEQPRSHAADDSRGRSPGELHCPGCRTRWIALDAAGSGLRMRRGSALPPLMRQTAEVLTGQLLEFAAKRLLLALL